MPHIFAKLKGVKFKDTLKENPKANLPEMTFMEEG